MENWLPAECTNGKTLLHTNDYFAWLNTLLEVMLKIFLGYLTFCKDLFF